MSDGRRTPDSRGRLLVRIGKVTVVRRPLQSMVCSGRLTICDQKFLLSSATYPIRDTTDTGCQIGPTLSHGDAIDDIDGRRCAYLIEASSAAEAIKHPLTMAVHDTRPNRVPRVAVRSCETSDFSSVPDADLRCWSATVRGLGGVACVLLRIWNTRPPPAEEASKIPNWPPFT